MTALEHFEKLLEFETDCWDVHEDLKSGKPDYTAVRLARLNREVKKMLGGIVGWKWEGFELE